MRSASVDLPWSIWAMMQKFRICAGAVNVLSAKLLMGISWSAGASRWAAYQGIDSGPLGHNRACPASLCLATMASQWKTFQRFAENLVFNEAPKLIRQLPNPEGASSSRASRSVWTALAAQANPSPVALTADGR